MNKERQPNSPEQWESGSSEAAHEAYERVEKQHEQAAERSVENREKNAETARHEIEAAAHERESAKQEKQAQSREKEHRPARTKSAQRQAYKKILRQTQNEMSGGSRAFSRVIHNPVIEKVSEVAGSTIARPNAMLMGAVFAFMLTLALYLIARFNGYPLSGTETIAAFIAGWIIGNLYDFFKTMATGKR